MKSALKRVMAAFLCLTLFAASVAMQPEEVRADEWLDYVNKCQNSMISFTRANTGLKSSDILGSAYLVGEDDMAGKSWLASCPKHDMYAVPAGTKINGKTVNPKYLPQDNKEYLISIREKYLVGNPYMTNSIYSKPEGFQGTFREGYRFYVFDYDEDWVTIWDDGFQAWSYVTGRFACGTDADAYMETHPAGFYRIARKKVWIDFGVKENHPWKSESEIPNVGTGTVTRLVYLRPVPNEKETVYTPVYALPRGTKLNVVSTELVPSQAGGSTKKYYKVSFNGSDKTQNNAVYYLHYKVPGMYYIDSRYLDFAKKGEKIPEGSVPAKIVNVTSKTSAYAYAAKDINSEKIGIMSKNYETWLFPSESDSEWTTIWFSGHKRYVQTKYISKADYKVKDISGLRLADIKDNNLIYTWNKGENNVDFSCKIIAQYGVLEKVLYSNEHVKKAQLTVKSSYLNKAEGKVKIVVQANNLNGGKGKELSTRFIQTLTSRLNVKNLRAHRTKITTNYRKLPNGKIHYFGTLGSCIQISTNKNFKNARTIQKSYMENGEKKYKQIYEIGNLKPNTTYYIRRRYMKDIKTAAGNRQFPTKWSETVKIKTLP